MATSTTTTARCPICEAEAHRRRLERMRRATFVGQGAGAAAVLVGIAAYVPWLMVAGLGASWAGFVWRRFAMRADREWLPAPLTADDREARGGPAFRANPRCPRHAAYDVG